ncbi:MAG: helix-turn-helix domain-containing protein [Acidimicrobiales bacterium]
MIFVGLADEEAVMFKVDAIELSGEARSELERRARSQTLPVRVVRRAQMILLCAEGVPLRQIAARVAIKEHQVSMWRRRFIAEGIEGLDDRARSGRPRRLGHDERMKMAAIATSRRNERWSSPWTRRPRSRPSHVSTPTRPPSPAGLDAESSSTSAMAPHRCSLPSMCTQRLSR